MRLKNIHLLILLALCWGPSFLFIKIAVVEIPPLLLAALRIGLGAVLLNAILLIKGDYLPKDKKFWLDVTIGGFFAIGLPFGLINWGQQFIDSGLASLINGLVPIFTIITAAVLMPSETIGENKIKAAGLGFIGLIILLYPSLKDGISASTFGIVAIALAAISYSIGLVYIKKRLTGIASFKAPAAQLLVVSFYLIPIGFLSKGSLDFLAVSLAAWGSVLALGVLGTAIAFIIYFKLIEQAGPSYASMVTYLMPVIGVILGVVFLKELLTIWTIGGGALILLGIYLANKKEPARKPTRVDVRLYTKFR